MPHPDVARFTNVSAKRRLRILDGPIVVDKEAIDFLAACARRPSARRREQLFNRSYLPWLRPGARPAIFRIIVLGHGSVLSPDGEFAVSTYLTTLGTGFHLLLATMLAALT